MLCCTTSMPKTYIISIVYSVLVIFFLKYVVKYFTLDKIRTFFKFNIVEWNIHVSVNIK